MVETAEQEVPQYDPLIARFRNLDSFRGDQVSLCLGVLAAHTEGPLTGWQAALNGDMMRMLKAEKIAECVSSVIGQDEDLMLAYDHLREESAAQIDRVRLARRASRSLQTPDSNVVHISEARSFGKAA